MRTRSGPFARRGRAMRTAPEVMGRSSGSGCAAHRKLSPWKRRVYERELRTGPGSAAKGRAEVPERSTGSCAYGTQGLAEEFARWSAPKVVLKESGSGSENNRKLSRSNACDWPRKAGGGWAPEVTLRQTGTGPETRKRWGKKGGHRKSGVKTPEPTLTCGRKRRYRRFGGTESAEARAEVGAA